MLGLTKLLHIGVTPSTSLAVDLRLSSKSDTTIASVYTTHHVDITVVSLLYHFLCFPATDPTV